MSLKLQMAGTGSAFAKNYFNNNALLYIGDYTLMIDFGITAPLALHQMNIPLDRIDGILITHMHADHIGGLEEFAFQMKYIFKKRIKLFVPRLLIQPLWEHSLKAGMESTEDAGLENFFALVPLEEGSPFKVADGLSMEILRTEHVPGKLSYSLLINETIFYSADIRFNRKLLEDIYNERKCRHVLHDCQLQPPETVHATLDQLLTLPEEIQKITLLMHYGDQMPDYIGKTGKMRFIEQHKIYTL